MLRLTRKAHEDVLI
jgi:histone H2A